MELAQVAAIKKNFDGLSQEDKDLAMDKMRQIRKHVEKRLPALADDDRACVSWLVTEILSALHDTTLSDASDWISSSLVAYGLATVDFLGWFDQQPSA